MIFDNKNVGLYQDTIITTKCTHFLAYKTFFVLARLQIHEVYKAAKIDDNIIILFDISL